MLPQNFRVHSWLLPLGPQATRNGRVSPKARAIIGEAPVLGGVFVAGHLAAASPVLVAHAPVLHIERLRGAIGGAQVGKGAALGVIAVFHPVAHFFRRAAADVGAEVGLRLNQPAQTDELMGAEGVVLNVVPPGDIDRLGPPGHGTDAVAPVVIVGETAARPAQYGHQPLQVLHRLPAIAVDIGNRRVLAHPQTAVDTRAQMLGELAVQFRADEANLLGSVDTDAGWLQGESSPGGQNRGRRRAGAEHEAAPRETC